MHQKGISIPLCTLFLCLFLPCAAWARDIIVTEADTGKKMVLQTGDTLSIVLEGNPTTGFTWKIASSNTSILKEVKTTYKSANALIGAGGIFLFTFQAVAEGTANLQCSYHRPWETESPPAKTFQLTLYISPSNT
jgi:inhibitor of cysteine peptidase